MTTIYEKIVLALLGIAVVIFICAFVGLAQTLSLCAKNNCFTNAMDAAYGQTRNQQPPLKE